MLEHMVIVDDMFVGADPRVVAQAVAQPARWQQWWPDLTLELSRDRGVKGCQWLVTGSMTGTAEIWLEPWDDGTIVHLIQRLEPFGAPARARAPQRAHDARVLDWKRHAVRLKDELEGRPIMAR